MLIKFYHVSKNDWDPSSSYFSSFQYLFWWQIFTFIFLNEKYRNEKYPNVCFIISDRIFIIMKYRWNIGVCKKG